MIPLYHFKSKSTGEIKQISPFISMCEACKKAMRKAISIHHWNELRKVMKTIYPIGVINQLDVSGHISIVLLKPIANDRKTKIKK